MGRKKILHPQDFDDLATGFRAEILRKQDEPIHHMACGACRQYLGKTEHAMQLTTTAFKKAAKRYATRHTLPLHEGQQAFSEILGFKTTHDALKRFLKDETKEHQDNSLPPIASMFWCDLNMSQFKVLIECLLLCRDSSSKSSDYEWSERGRSLLKMGLNLMDLEKTGPMSTAEIFEWLELDNLEKIHSISIARNQSSNGEATPVSEWSASDRQLRRYLMGLPGYDPKKLNKKGGQGDDTRLHHSYLLGTLNRLSDLLTAIEAAGGATACPITATMTRSADTNVCLAINRLISERRHPSNTHEATAILLAAEIAELYPTQSEHNFTA